MIPIKWNEEEQVWVITTKEDKEWYNYENGLWANVMLSDGYYKSELQIGTTQEQLAEKNIGEKIEDNQLGSIFTWIPRFAYLDDQILYLKGSSILEYKWTTESCFNLFKYGINSLDLAFDGVWIGEKEFFETGKTEEELSKQLENRNNQIMINENNVQGLIANEQVMSTGNSEIKAVKKLLQKYSETNKTMVQNAETMKYRQVIKIINTNKKVPISARHVVTGENIIIKDTYTEYGIKYIIDENGNILERNTIETNEEDTIYVAYIVDNIGNIKKYKANYGTGRPDISKFNKSITYYVTYDEFGNEDSSIPIGEKAPENWYNYEEQKWANIVIRDSGNENYYVWIPRYMYKINDDDSQTVDAKIVNLDNIWEKSETEEIDLNNTEYQLPEAFTWQIINEDGEEETIQLKGFWYSKYKLRADAGYNPEITASGQKITIKNIVTHYGTGYNYEMYLVKDGKRIVFDEATSSYKEGTEPIQLTQADYTFQNLEPGNYGINIIVKDKSGNFVKGIGKSITILEPEVEEPDLTGFNKNLTYYVTYDELGNEDSSIPIGENPPENWYNYEEQKWANIVVREDGSESYFVWIPRYEYSLEPTTQQSIAQFIPVSQEQATSGYQIPEAFTWEVTNEDGTTKTMPLPGFWYSKYKLRYDLSPRLSATVSGAGTKINVSNVVSANNTVNYPVYLIKDGKTVAKNVIVTKSGSVEFDIQELGTGYGTYSVLVIDETVTSGTLGGYAKEIVLTEPKAPDITGFNANVTYIVTYNDSGTESTQLLNDILTQDSVVNEDGTIASGKVDESKINGVWYDYGTQKWANIVIKDAGNTSYFVWIPRYEYSLNEISQEVNAILIPTTQTNPDPGYQIPEAFTWEITSEDGSKNTIPLPGFWFSKYKLRQGN